VLLQVAIMVLIGHTGYGGTVRAVLERLGLLLGLQQILHLKEDLHLKLG